jgi:hypothetical protein
MWIVSYFVLTCYAMAVENLAIAQHQNTLLCHYLGRWLLTSSLEVWTKKFCFFTINNTDYFRCDYKTCYFKCAKGSTFKSVVVGKPRWSDMEGPCAQLCTMSFSQCEWPNWPIINHGSSWPIMYVMWAIFRNHHYVDLWLMFLRWAHGFAFNVFKRPRFLRSNSRISLRFSFMVIHI